MTAAPAKLEQRPVFDLYVSALSVLCLIHCLALPVIAGLLPLSLAFAESEWVHKLIVLSAAPVTFALVIADLLQRVRWWFIVAASMGTLLMLGATFVGPEAWEEPLTVVGASITGLAHLVRWRHNRHQYARQATSV